MKQILLFPLVLLALVACGSSEDDAAEELSDNTITLDPPPGEYTYRPWVRAYKEETGMGSGVLKVLPPGEDEFKDASCVYAPYDVSIDYDCVEIRETGTLTYYLYNIAAEGKKHSAEYTINLEQNDLTITSIEQPPEVSDPMPFKLEEVDTLCRYKNVDEKVLYVSIQTKNSSKLGETSYAYLGFTIIKGSKAGDTITITEENEDNLVGITIKPKSDEIPNGNYSTIDDYTSSPGVDWETNSRPETSCAIKVSEFAFASDVSGTVECEGLRNYDAEVEASDKPLGKYVKLSGDWRCDRFE